MRVVFTVLDALPARHVGGDHTPVLAELAGGAPGRARSVMTSATYPNHATFATGAAPRDHGIVTNWVPETGRVVPAWQHGPRVPTLFDACREARRSSAAVFSDQYLVGVMGARAADDHWPPDGVPPGDARLDAHGYVEDRDTLVELGRALDAGPDLVVCQLNAPDTAAHVFGPDNEGALATYRATDTLLAEMREHLAWDDTVWIIVSDHDQEPVDVREAIDLRPEFDRRGLELFALPEGSASVVCGDGAHAARSWLASVEGVEGTAPFHAVDTELECCLVWSEPGRAFGFAETPAELGTHGGPRARAQVAVVTGGHPLVETLARTIVATPVGAADWAPTIATLLGIDVPHATGRALLA
jgi:Type I phosphodiesterase / nucleotide pyrophosphatase